MDKVKEAKDWCDILNAILLLEYHDKNYLPPTLARNPARMNEEQRRIIGHIKHLLGGDKRETPGI